jgi:hypothetical protein
VRTILAGERDPKKLAELSHPRQARYCSSLTFSILVMAN